MQIKNSHIVLIAAVALLSFTSTCRAQEKIDIIAYFDNARAEGRDGIARKTRTVDVRPSAPGEIVITNIRGEGAKPSGQTRGHGRSQSVSGNWKRGGSCSS